MSIPPAAAPHRDLRGASLFRLGLLLFACMDSTTKYLAERCDVPLIVAVRYIVNCLLMVAQRRVCARKAAKPRRYSRQTIQNLFPPRYPVSGGGGASRVDLFLHRRRRVPGASEIPDSWRLCGFAWDKKEVGHAKPLRAPSLNAPAMLLPPVVEAPPAR